jgi:hypothetical protein
VDASVGHLEDHVCRRDETREAVDTSGDRSPALLQGFFIDATGQPTCPRRIVSHTGHRALTHGAAGLEEGTMNDFTNHDGPPAVQVDREARHHNSAHGSHHLLMMLCCVPMVAIVVLLVTTGTATAGALLVPVACMVMMALMMAFMMPKDH